MVEAYWRIGRRIGEEEQKGQARAEYGHELIKELAKRLGDEFGKGFSVANLLNFRQFYLTFPEKDKLYALRRELGWSHYRLIMWVDEPEARQFYIGEAANHGWTTRELERNIRSGWHQRLLHRPATDAPSHSHLLAEDSGGAKTIAGSIQLAAGRTAQEFNRRKGRIGAFWEDRYHATPLKPAFC